MNNRQEQIEQAKRLIATGISGDLVAVLHQQFPELKESEDERIRKEIIDWMKGGTTYDWRENKEKWLAYLERQKENPKSCDSIPSDCTSDAKYEDRWHKVTDSLPDNGREVLAKDKLGNTLLARYDGEGWDVSVYDDEDYRCHNGISKWCEIPSEKQKGQKPADDKAFEEWIEDWWKHNKVNNPDSYDKGDEIQFDEKGFKNFCRGIRNMYQQKPTECIEDSVKFEEGFKAGRESGLRDGQKYVLNNLDSYGLCKVSEWSEEDEVYLRVAICMVHDKEGDCKYSQYILDETENWLKSLRPQPKAELTLLDKNIIEAAVAFVEQNDHFSCWGGIDKQMVIKALRSLKPHWKPTEEQMRAIRLARSFVVDDFSEKPTLSETLKELEEQLKKL